MSRSDIRFLLGFEPQNLEGIDPNRTVLGWLREEKGLIGTKEGCAEGDCGACTVVLASLESGALRYKPVNACILFMPQLDGRQLITIEHLKDENGNLHPIQQAMVEQHASQCGFCTPGFVLSLFAFTKDANGQDRSSQAVCDALQGNLCRCTGYRPILEAGNALDRGFDDVFDRRESETIAALENLDTKEPLKIESHGRSYIAPTSLDELATASSQSRARLLAGSTDVGLWVTKQHQDLDALIDVTRVPELTRIVEEDSVLKVGAACSYEKIWPVFAQHWSDFGELIRRIGGAQIRAAGTIGGNIANGSPIGDTMPALIALGATLLLQKEKKQRTLPLEDFYLGYQQTALQPGEFVAEIHIPKSALDLRCYKISKRFDQDITAVLAAMALELSPDRTVKHIRIAFGGMAAVPKRAFATEQAIINKPWSEATIEAAQAVLAQEFAPISDMRASKDYRLIIAKNLMKKALIEMTEPEAKTRVATRKAIG